MPPLHWTNWSSIVPIQSSFLARLSSKCDEIWVLIFKKITTSPTPPPPPNHAKASSDLTAESTNNLPLVTYPTFDYWLKSLIDTHTHTYTLSLSLTHTYTLSLSLTLTHTYTLSLSLLHTYTLSLTHTHTPSLSLTYTHTHTHTHTVLTTESTSTLPFAPHSMFHFRSRLHKEI